MNSRCFVYGLLDPRTDELRYVGKSTSGMTRPRSHCFPSQLRHHNRRIAWLKSLLAENLRPEVVILEEVASTETLEILEKQAIAHYREAGFDLVNGTDGGEGCSGRKLSEDARRRISEARKGKHPSAESRLRMSESQRHRFEKNPMTVEQIEKMRAGLLSRSQEEAVAAHKRAGEATADSNRSRIWTEASRKKLSETNKRLGRKPPPRTSSRRG